MTISPTFDTLTVNGTITGTYSGNGGPLTATPTGGTASRSMQQDFLTHLTPEAFGAAGDGTTDDTTAINAWFAYVASQSVSGQPPHSANFGNGRKYLVTSINFTGATNLQIHGNGSRILGTAGTLHPIIDMLGSSYIWLKDLHINAGSQASPCLTAITYGVHDASGPKAQVMFSNIRIDGYFTQGAIQNSGSEVHSEYGLSVINRYTSGSPGSSYVLIQDGTHHWDLDSLYVTDTRVRDSYSSFQGQRIIGGNYQHVGDGSFMWLSAANDHVYNPSYVQSGNSVPVIYALFTNVGGSSIYGTAFRSVEFNFHAEPAGGSGHGYSSLIFLTGYATPSISGLKIHDSFVYSAATTGTIFTADTGVTTVTLDHVDINLPLWLNSGAVLFDQPSVYKITGTITMPSANKASFNGAAAFSGTIITDAAATFKAGWTAPTTGAYLIIDSATRLTNLVTTTQLNAGASNTVSGTNSASLFGTNHSVTGNNSAAEGNSASDRGRPDGVAFSSGEFSAPGDAQSYRAVLRGTGNSTSAITLTVNNSAVTSINAVNLVTGNMCQSMDHRLIIRDVTTGDFAIWTLIGAGVSRGANIATTALAATTFPSWTKLSASSATAGGWSAPTITADTTNGAAVVSWTPPALNTDTFHVVDFVTCVEVL